MYLDSISGSPEAHIPMIIENTFFSNKTVDF